MPPLTPPATADVVIRHRVTPLFYWAISVAMLAFMAAIVAEVLAPGPGAPPMGWLDWLGMAAIVAVAAFCAGLPFRAPLTWLTLGADGSVRLATRTPFARREMRLDPGSVAQVLLRRNFFGPILGWQVILQWPDGRRLVVSERVNGALQQALAEKLERRLGLAPRP